MVHETCHMFGVLHCVYWHCLMNGSNGPSDSAGASFLCPVCLRKLMHALRGLVGPVTVTTINERYASMLAALQHLLCEMDPDGESQDLAKEFEWLENRRAQLLELENS